MLQVSTTRFPENSAVINDTGLPFGCAVTPLAPLEDPPPGCIELPSAEELARCDGCGAYINPYCSFLRFDWRCSLCGALTPTPERYRSARARKELPELRADAVQLFFDGEGESRGAP